MEGEIGVAVLAEAAVAEEDGVGVAASRCYESAGGSFVLERDTEGYATGYEPFGHVRNISRPVRFTRRNAVRTGFRLNRANKTAPCCGR